MRLPESADRTKITAKTLSAGLHSCSYNEAGVSRQDACCRIERRQQFVTRRVRLPESADMTKITAKMDNGTLVIDVPKNPDKVRQRQIDVS